MSIVEETYATVSEADSILGSDLLPWNDAETTEKQTALEWAVVYMNDTYSIPEQSTIPDVLKNANSMFANYHLSESLFVAEKNAKQEKGLKSKSVKADVVETKKEYDQYIASAFQDQYPEVTAMLSIHGYYIKKSSGISTAPLLRR